jgi:arsenite methyltransferase
VSGALAERDFVAKLEKAGFADIEVVAREPRSIDDFELYPLFTPELIGLMRALIPLEQQSSVATAAVFQARRGPGGARPAPG